jgi:hypothetical protein
MKGKPEVFEFSDLCVVSAPSQVYDVSYSEGLQVLHMCLGFNCASEREPIAHEESLHRLGPLSNSDRPRRLENLYLPNAVFVRFVPAVSVTCGYPFNGDF